MYHSTQGLTLGPWSTESQFSTRPSCWPLGCVWPWLLALELSDLHFELLPWSALPPQLIWALSGPWLPSSDLAAGLTYALWDGGALPCWLSYPRLLILEGTASPSWSLTLESSLWRGDSLERLILVWNTSSSTSTAQQKHVALGISCLPTGEGDTVHQSCAFLHISSVVNVLSPAHQLQN